MHNEEEQPSPTVPTDIRVTLQGASEAELKELWSRMSVCVGVISTRIDLTTLDGITVSADYLRALAGFDRGVEVLENDNRLKPTSDAYAVGVAMTPTFLRDGHVKSHMLFEYSHIRGIGFDTDSGEFRSAFHTLMHECAHVEAASRFDSAFPGVLLHPCPDSWSALEEVKWKYAIAARRSAAFGPAPAPAPLAVQPQASATPVRSRIPGTASAGVGVRVSAAGVGSSRPVAGKARRPVSGTSAQPFPSLRPRGGPETETQPRGDALGSKGRKGRGRRSLRVFSRPCPWSLPAGRPSLTLPATRRC